ncbi:Ig-like domain-containing protein, partial [Limnohabitans sp. 2KL-51]|uniref:Ig-like domain-containing protein n=1 Tax=Limnohabitans sp. 2KL-51 TaxID=1977911 RepID=UPI000DD229C4
QSAKLAGGAALSTTSGPATITGQYGTLVMGTNGSYTYTVNNNNATVQALRTSGQTLTEVFSYTAASGTSTETASLVVTVQGANDAPTVVVQEADKALNVGTALTPFSVSSNFADVDSAGNGETASLTATLTGGAALPSWLTFNAASGIFSGTPPAAGTTSVTVTRTDAAGLSVSDTFLITVNPVVDSTPPKVVVSRTNAGTTLASGATETLTFTLSEAATDFSLADIDVTGGTLSNFTAMPSSGTPGTGYTVYTATFTPAASSSGTATVGVLSGKFSDNAGNNNDDTYTASASGYEANNQVSLAYNTVPLDTAPPKIALSRAGSGDLALGGSDTITFVLSEASTTFSLADVDVTGGTLAGFAPVTSSGSAAGGYHEYTAIFTPTANALGTAAIGVASSKFTDAAGNANLDTYLTGVAGTSLEANNLININYNTQLPDTQPPGIIVSRAAAGMVSSSETIYFTLSEASTNFVQGDIDVVGGTLSNFAPVPSSGTASAGYTQYSATFTPTANAQGTATIAV